MESVISSKVICPAGASNSRIWDNESEIFRVAWMTLEAITKSKSPEIPCSFGGRSISNNSHFIPANDWRRRRPSAKKWCDTSVKTYSTSHPILWSSLRTWTVVPPVPAPISRIRNGRFGTLLIPMRIAWQRPPFIHMAQWDSSYSAVSSDMSPSGKSTLKGSFSPRSTNRRCLPQRRINVVSIDSPSRSKLWSICPAAMLWRCRK